MQLPDLLSALIPVATALRRLGVRHYVCGSAASSYYGASRMTADVDVVAELLPSHVAPFANSLRPDYYVDERMILDAISRKSCFNVIHLPTNFKIDVFAVKNRDHDKNAMDRAEERLLDEDIPDSRFSLASVEDTLLAKLEWYRLGDEVSERQWSDVVGVIRVNRASLDRQYLEKWAEELAVADLLAKAWKEVESLFS
jgi:hypothetical protein